jgi:Na+/alanine symporter
MNKGTAIHFLRIVCIVIVILAAVIILVSAYGIALPDNIQRLVGILNLCALIGLSYTTFKKMEDK